MIKQTIKSRDFNGKEYVEDYYFHLTEAEIAEWELSTEGGLSSKLVAIMKSGNVGEVLPIFKDLLIKSYGERSADGKLFIKSDEVKQKFIYSQAFSDLYMLLATNSDAAAEFVKGILPNMDDATKDKIDGIIKSTDDVDTIIEKLGADA